MVFLKISMILFLGAGVSKLFDIPDTRGFIDIFDKDSEISQNYIYKRIKKSFSDYFDLEILMTILEDLKNDRDRLLSSISPQTTDFIFNNIDEIEYYLNDEILKMESKELINRVKHIIRTECFKAESESKDKILDIYDRFFMTLSKVGQSYSSGDNKITYPSDTKICTTNYDRCIETYLSERQIEYTQGLLHKYGLTYFDISSYNDNNIRVGLFKLHGTIDLFNIDGMIRQRKFGEESGEEIVYYPIEFSGYQKIIESPYLEIFYLFRERINRDNNWIIIGSSLRDRTICSIMNDVIRLKPIAQRPKVICINPNNSIMDRLKNWGFINLEERIRQNFIENYFGSDDINQEILKYLQTNIPS